LKDWNDVLMRYGSEVLRRELGDDQVDDVDATDVVREVQGRLPREDVAVRQASNPASIEIRDPFTDEWIEIDATICPESWRRQAELEVTRRNERQGLWKPP
jgi:hypothetical protein